MMGSVGVTVARAQVEPDREHQIKAAFMYNFTKFFQWPSDARGVRTICVLGDDPFGNALGNLDGKAAGEEVIRTRRVSDVGEATECDILFISGSETDRLERIQEQLRGRNILTVGDMERFAERGGMVGLIRRRNKIGVVINVGAVAGAGLEAKSALLHLAEIIR